MSPSEGQEMGKRVWRGVSRELLGWAAVSPAKSLGCVRACGIHIGLVLGLHGHRLPLNLCSPSCTLSLAALLFLLKKLPSSFGTLSCHTLV